MPRSPIPTALAASADPMDHGDAEVAPDLADLFRSYGGYVATIVLRILGRREEVEDVVQDVFLSAMTSLPRLRSAAAVKGWLAAIAVRRASDRLRRRRFWAFLRITPAQERGLADTGASPEAKAQCAQVYEALDRLPVPQRVAWTLRHLEGEALDEVARLCGCSLATAKRRIAAAQAVLAARVRGLDDG